jgi:hypothetical protein
MQSKDVYMFDLVLNTGNYNKYKWNRKILTYSLHDDALLILDVEYHISTNQTQRLIFSSQLKQVSKCT